MYYTHVDNSTKIRYGVRWLRSDGFEVLTAVNMKGAIFWDPTPYSPVEVHQRFERPYCLYLQDLRISQLSKKQETGSKNNSFLLSLLFDPEDGSSTVLRNIEDFHQLHGIELLRLHKLYTYTYI
jgi:hypothetical protein